jgi:6,7-dimethyl-8-ribityllumazine synthase
MAQSAASPSLLQTDNLAFETPPRLAVVYTEWNEAIVREQLAGFDRVVSGVSGIVTERLVVPGSFELPFGCRLAARAGSPEAIIAFGAVIRGGTPHFEYVSQAATQGIMQLNLTLDVPVIFGVLTLDTEAQAWERLGGTHGHKGEEAAITALKMIWEARRFGSKTRM